MIRSGRARLLGWMAAGVASAALLSGAALSLTLARKPEPAPLFLTMDPSPPANLTVAALADPAPTVVDEAPDLADPVAPPAEAAPPLSDPDDAPVVARSPAISAPPPDVPVQADLSIPTATPEPRPEPEPLPEPEPQPKVKAEPKPKKAEAKPKTKLKPKAEPKAKPRPQTAEARPKERKSASAGASAPTAGAKATGGQKTSHAAYAKAVMKKVRATRKKSGAGRGTVVVAFTIAADGGLAGVRIVKSSGNAVLDGIATDHIRRSAPFPAPPKGAGTSYSFEFVGK